MFTTIVSRNAGLRFVANSVLVLLLICICSKAEPAFAKTETEFSDSQNGISVAIIPPEARPGDIVELRVEMDRENWGRFNVRLPDHPQLRVVAREKIPVSYNDQRYQQRYSMLFQPVSSGDILIDGVIVRLLTDDGEKLIELPVLNLCVKKFEDVTLSDAPLPLPSAEQQSPTNAMPLWLNVLIGAAVVSSLVLFSFLRSRESTPSPARVRQELSTTAHIIDRLRSGTIPKTELEVLLNDPSMSFSAELRNKIEEAVYAVQSDPSELVTSLKKELPT